MTMADDEQHGGARAVRFTGDRCVQILSELASHVGGEDERAERMQRDIAIAHDAMHEPYDTSRAIIDNNHIDDDGDHIASEHEYEHEYEYEYEYEYCEPFASLDSWTFDVFAACDTTNGAGGGSSLPPLHSVCRELLTRYSLYDRYCSADTMRAFLCQLERGYATHANAYHNSHHAADVLATFHHMLLRGGVLHRLAPIELFSCVLAAAIHDYEHPGVTEHFLIRTRDAHAIAYNDMHVLENHHVSAVYAMMEEQPLLDIRQRMTEHDRSSMREMVVAMVLATDMRMHHEHVSKFSTRARVGGSFDLRERRDRMNVLCMALKMADISNAAKPWHISVQWTRRITEEFCAQGDRERALGLAPSPRMDRRAPAVAEAQLGFIDHVVAPAMDIFTTSFPSLRHILAQLKHNRRRWEETAVEL